MFNRTWIQNLNRHAWRNKSKANGLVNSIGGTLSAIYRSCDPNPEILTRLERQATNLVNTACDLRDEVNEMINKVNSETRSKADKIADQLTEWQRYNDIDLEPGQYTLGLDVRGNLETVTIRVKNGNAKVGQRR